VAQVRGPLARALRHALAMSRRQLAARISVSSLALSLAVAAWAFAAELLRRL